MQCQTSARQTIEQVTTELTLQYERLKQQQQQQQIEDLEKKVKRWRARRRFTRFALLPAELRLRIYEFYIHEQAQRRTRYRAVQESLGPRLQGLPHVLPLARTSRDIRAEFLDQHFEHHLFLVQLWSPTHQRIVGQDHAPLSLLRMEKGSETFFNHSTDYRLRKIRRLLVRLPFLRGVRDYDYLQWTMDFASKELQADMIPPRLLKKKVRMLLSKIEDNVRMVFERIVSDGALRREHVQLSLDALRDSSTEPCCIGCCLTPWTAEQPHRAKMREHLS
ncbi:Putative 2EXR domain-containing protein [Septoria linicola]|uniref:2EXR domain-containing protein n=1 Tax=Septoria linicola TaxID=215465 RepID=A0A9Q9B739_9PEZI|nr:Putative 2EXR domain-containing protein [Septoria linicola]